MNNDNQNNEAKEALESSLESLGPDQTEQNNHQDQQPQPQQPKSSSFFNKIFGDITKKATVYMSLFIVLAVIVVVLTIIGYNRTRSSQPSIAEQPLSNSALNKIASSSEVVGGSNQLLTVQSSSIFNGQVLVRNNLQVAGKLEVGGSLSLTGIVVSGNSVFDTVQINKNLLVGGNTTLQGTLAIQNNLTVNGSANFSGSISAPQLTTGSLQLNGNLSLTHHLTIGGPIPGRTTGAALGSGGTSSLNGSDSSGTITLNAGNGAYAGCYISVSFVTPFNTTPKLLITPVGPSTATLNYYVNRTINNFSICSINSPAPGQSYTFDYLAID
jgi:cytoskeletal protein CcmA (bactofilin family)